MKKINKMFLIIVAILTFAVYVTGGIKTNGAIANELQGENDIEYKSHDWNLRIEENNICWNTPDLTDVALLCELTIKGDGVEQSYEFYSNSFPLMALRGFEPGYYDITVGLVWGYYLDSEPLTYYYDGRFLPLLETPQNLQQNQDILTWDSVENATGYEITVTKIIYAGIYPDSLLINVTENYYSLNDFALYDYDIDQYYFAVKALGDNDKYADSNYSKSLTLVYEASDPGDTSDLGDTDGNGDTSGNGDTDGNGDTSGNGGGGIGLTEILLISFGCVVFIAAAIFCFVIILKSKRKADKSQSATEANPPMSFNLDSCTEEELRTRCHQRFKRDVDYKTERAIKHFILRLPHNEIDKNPKQSQMERMRMRKILK